MVDNIKIFQIAYDQFTLEQVDSSGFFLLDNLSNERPDWYEYWPIRKYLLSTKLQDDTWYGFFSPKFTQKTQLSFKDTCEFISSSEKNKDIDVALFSPQPDMGANFLNVFEQAELFDPGFIKVAQEFIGLHGVHVPLESLVMDSRQIVFSNYVVAKPIFWREWFVLTESLFAMAENKSHHLHELLCHNTSYARNAPRKVFLMERLASLLLYLKPKYKVVVANTFEFGWSMSNFREYPETAYINDALKIAFCETGYGQYIDAFRKVREKFY
jgi:hypothetical protein